MDKGNGRSELPLKALPEDEDVCVSARTGGKDRRRYRITQSQFDAIMKAESRQQTWEAVRSLFIGVGIGLLMLMFTNAWWWSFGVMAMGLAAGYSGKQKRAWEKKRMQTLEQVRLSEFLIDG